MAQRSAAADGLDSDAGASAAGHGEFPRFPKSDGGPHRASHPQSQIQNPMYSYSKLVLPNGLRVLYLEMPHIHSVVAACYVGVGSRYEDEHSLGLSHLLEHMLFRATQRFSSSVELLTAIDEIGGESDAYTSPEYCAYLLRAHSRHCEDAIRFLADIVLSANFKDADLATEKRVICEEISQFKDVSGDYVSIDDLSYNLMWKTASLNSFSFGSEDTVQDFTRGRLLDHYHAHYLPNNMVLCVSGNFDRKRAEGVIHELFGGLQGRFEGRPARQPSEQTEPRTAYQRIRAQMVYFKLCHKAYSYRHPKLLPMLLISDVLGGSTSSRLLSSIRERQGLVYDISATPNLFSDFGSVDIYGATGKANFLKTVAAVMTELRKLAEYGVSESELKRTEERAFTQMQLIMDSPLDMVNWFGIEELLISPDAPDTPEKQAEKVRNVKLDDITQVIADIFTPSKRNLALIGPCGWWQKRKVKNLLQH
ncbi:MAG: insulinase family protein, partial [Planctomycetes bacterium]|nr:insulinase family protein [Planctomycetota bacterium]